jgi:hypothetical protein
VLEVEALDRELREQPGGERAQEAAQEQTPSRGVANVGLLKHRCFVQLAEIGAAAREEVHMAVLDAGKQQIVGGTAGALDVR